MVLLLAALFGGPQTRSAQTADGAFGFAFVAVASWAAFGGAARLRVRMRQMSTQKPGVFQAIIGSTVIGAFGTVFGVAGLVSNVDLRAHGVTTSAAVAHVTHLKSTTYFLRYTLPTGHTGTCSTEDVLGAPSEGDQVEVLYDSTEPFSGCQSADYGMGDTDEYVFLGFGIAGFTGGIALLALSCRWVAGVRTEP